MWFRCWIWMIYIDLWWLNGDLSNQNDDVMGRFKGPPLWQSNMAEKFLIKMEASRWKKSSQPCLMTPEGSEGSRDWFTTRDLDGSSSAKSYDFLKSRSLRVHTGETDQLFSPRTCISYILFVTLWSTFTKNYGKSPCY